VYGARQARAAKSSPAHPRDPRIGIGVSSNSTVDSGRILHCTSSPGWRCSNTFQFNVAPGIQPHLDQYFYDARFYFLSPAGLSIRAACNAAKIFDCQQEAAQPATLCVEPTLLMVTQPVTLLGTFSLTAGKLLRIFLSQVHFWSMLWQGLPGIFFFHGCSRHPACAGYRLSALGIITVMTWGRRTAAENPHKS